LTRNLDMGGRFGVSQTVKHFTTAVTGSPELVHATGMAAGAAYFQLGDCETADCCMIRDDTSERRCLPHQRADRPLAMDRNQL